MEAARDECNMGLADRDGSEADVEEGIRWVR